MTYIFIHGAGDVAWYWHRVSAELRRRGEEVVAVDLPCEDESAGWSDYAGAVVDAMGDREDLIVVAQSAGSRPRWFAPGGRPACWSSSPG